MKSRAYIETTDQDDDTSCLIFIDSISHLMKSTAGENFKTCIVMKNNDRINIEASIQQVKDMIAACYGAEDEED